MTVGRHLLGELYGCAASVMNDEPLLARAALDAVRASGGTILGSQSHRFAPHGVTVVVMVAESHLALHSWPEHGYLAFDYFTCATHVDPEAALRVIAEAVAPERVERISIERGAALAIGPAPEPPEW